MIAKGNTEDKIINALEKMLGILETKTPEVKKLIENISVEIKPYEDYLDSIPSYEFEFHYGKSFQIRTLIDSIKNFKTNI